MNTLNDYFISLLYLPHAIFPGKLAEAELSITENQTLNTENLLHML